MKNIKREKYLQSIRPYFNKPLIKVLTGQRRVGKSYLLKQIADEIREQNPGSNIIFIDFEKFEFEEIKTYQDLHAHIKLNSLQSYNYIFIDEIQEIEGFEKVLRSLLSDGNYDIYVTGSNSNIFSSELATFLSGRQIEIFVQSLSFVEFLEFNDLQAEKISLERYLKHGGLPFICNLPNDDDLVFDYLKNIYATILYRDIVSRNQIRDIPFLENLNRFLADNIGSIVSATRISDFLKSQKQSKSVPVVLTYLGYLCRAYFLSKVERQEIAGKRIFETGEKYYFQDLGLRNCIIGFKPNDIGKIIENVVYNHLIYKGFNITVGKDSNKEVDFIAEKKGEYAYYQCTYLLSNEKVVEREFGNLIRIPDNYPKFVISMDEFPITSSYKGIKHLKLIDFLMM